MLTCPMCKKPVRGLLKECPSCRADLGLLVDYVENLDHGLERAAALVRECQLGPAVWAYLEVLEVDPDNPEARRQVGQVVTAVRQFDRAAPQRRWLERLRRQERLRRWLTTVGGDLPEEAPGQAWQTLRSIIGAALLLALGFVGGYLAARTGPAPEPSVISTP
jgi:hypothetical protein